MMQNILRTSIRFATVAVLAIGSATCHADHVHWQTDVEKSLQTANTSGKLVLLKFTADWCTYCKKMERETFTQPQVAALVNRDFVPVLVDADKYQPLVKHLKIKGLPSLVIASPDMVILKRIAGYQTEDKLMPQLQAVIAAHSQSASQQTALAATKRHSTATAPTRPVSQQTVSAPAPQQAAPPSFGGLCLPAVGETRTLIQGKPQFASTYRGKTLFFSSEEYRQKFQANPAKYWPMLDGTCPVTLAEQGTVMEGRLEYAAMFRDKVWVTSSPEQMKKFVASPARIVDAIAKQSGAGTVR